MAFTQEQLQRLSTLNKKMYKSINGGSDNIEDFDAFILQYENLINFYEKHNYFQNSMRRTMEESYMNINIRKGKKDRTHKQNALIYLQTGKTLTCLEAIEFLGNIRIAASICELRKEGYDIEDVSRTHWSRYKLNQE
jgi:hypothetical protein